MRQGAQHVLDAPLGVGNETLQDLERIEQTGSPTREEQILLEASIHDKVGPSVRRTSTTTLQSSDLPSQTKERESAEIIYVEWAEGDKSNPYNWPEWKKALVAFIGCSVTFQTAICAVCYAWGADEIAREFDVSVTVSLLGVSLYTFAFGLAPMALAPLSEVYGRLPLYIGTYGFFTLVQLPNALTPSFAGVLICRFLAGAAASTGSAMVGGTLADMYHSNKRGMPMAFFTSTTLLGSAVGSIFPAYVVASPKLGWRWIFWIELILNGVSMVILLFVIRESRGSVLLSRRAASLRKETGDNRYVCAADAARESLIVMIRSSLTRPFFFLVCEPAVTLFSIWVCYT
jgi:multidrug resistance protein